jgi:hypothetical protein
MRHVPSRFGPGSKGTQDPRVVLAQEIRLLHRLHRDTARASLCECCRDLTTDGLNAAGDLRADDRGQVADVDVVRVAFVPKRQGAVNGAPPQVGSLDGIGVSNGPCSGC